MRKVLWFVNFMFPDLCDHLGLKGHYGGGWVYSTSQLLVNDSEFCPVILNFQEKWKELSFYSLKGTEFVVIPASFKGNQSRLYETYNAIVKKFNPEIVHIHGTEFPEALHFLDWFKEIPSTVNIQGMVGVYHRYFYGGISKFEVFRRTKVKELLSKSSLFHQKASFYRRGQSEREMIFKAQIVTGRTFWDYSHAVEINSMVNYHRVDDCLRETFYVGPKWSLKKAKRHRILISQAGYPIKGLHKLLDSLKIVKSLYPELQLIILGNPGFYEPALLNRLNITGAAYPEYIYKMLQRLDIEVIVKGGLGPEQVMQELRDAHICVIPSAIENAPNTLAEAQITGTPSIAAHVGGVADMIAHRENGIYYRFEEVEMLAAWINRIFQNDDLAMELSKNAIKTAEERHDRAKILQQVKEVYYLLSGRE